MADGQSGRAERFAAALGRAQDRGSPDRILSWCLGELSRDVAFKGGSMALLDDRDELVMVAAFGTIDDAARRVRLRKGEGIAGTVAATGRTIYAGDLDYAAPVAPAARSVGTNRLIRSYLCAPLTSRGRVIGVLQVDSDQPHAFTAEDIALFEEIVGEVANSDALREARATLLPSRDPS